MSRHALVGQVGDEQWSQMSALSRQRAKLTVIQGLCLFRIAGCPQWWKNVRIAYDCGLRPSSCRGILLSDPSSALAVHDCMEVRKRPGSTVLALLLEPRRPRQYRDTDEHKRSGFWAAISPSKVTVASVAANPEFVRSSFQFFLQALGACVGKESAGILKKV